MGVEQEKIDFHRVGRGRHQKLHLLLPRHCTWSWACSLSRSGGGELGVCGARGERAESIAWLPQVCIQDLGSFCPSEGASPNSFIAGDHFFLFAQKHCMSWAPCFA